MSDDFLIKFSKSILFFRKKLFYCELTNDATYLADLPVPIQNLAEKAKQTLEINGVSYIPEYKSLVTFN